MARPGFSPRAEVAERRARVLALRSQHVSYTDIAAELHIPASTARSDYQRALEDYAARQREQAHLAVTREQAKLDEMEQAAWAVPRARHITVQHGKVVTDEDGATILDDAPVLNAIDRLVRIAHRRATLTGIDAPAKVEVSDARRAEIERLAAHLAAAGGVADLDPAGAGAAPGDAPPGEGGPHPA